MPVTINGSAGVTTNTGAVYDSIQRATAQASTSGTSIDFTSIPSWVKRITVMFDGVSTNGTSGKQIQIGDSGGIENTGYLSASASVFASTPVPANSTTGFLCTESSVAARAESGIITICNQTGNVWVMQSSLSQNTFALLYFGAGTKTLSATLDRVRITTVNGTDTFDAGTINILYE
jgi:hypothetical protein